MRRAYHGTGNRLAPAVHFSEGGKTAYCNASLMQFARSRDVLEASGTEGVSSVQRFAPVRRPAARRNKGLAFV